MNFEVSFFVVSLLTSCVFHWPLPRPPPPRHTPGSHHSSSIDHVSSFLEVLSVAHFISTQAQLQTASALTVLVALLVTAQQARKLRQQKELNGIILGVCRIGRQAGAQA